MGCFIFLELGCKMQVFSTQRHMRVSLRWWVHFKNRQCKSSLAFYCLWMDLGKSKANSNVDLISKSGWPRDYTAILSHDTVNPLSLSALNLSLRTQANLVFTLCHENVSHPSLPMFDLHTLYVSFPRVALCRLADSETLALTCTLTWRSKYWEFLVLFLLRFWQGSMRESTWICRS